MLSLLKIKNFALIDELSLEFGEGLNLLTGETGSGKSIIVDSLGALLGKRVSSDSIKEGAPKALIEGVFSVYENDEILKIFEKSGIELEDEKNIDVIICREISATGRNRVFVNNQLITQGLLKKIGSHLADIQGQGEQTTIFKSTNHLQILDEYALLEDERRKNAEKFCELTAIRSELKMLREDKSRRLQLMDTLRFQVEEISAANLELGEDEVLENEKRRSKNIEKLSDLSEESYAYLYENREATLSTLDKVLRNVSELAEYESNFKEYLETLETAKAILEDLSITIRDFKNSLRFSPKRLEEIENRLAEISLLKRKYGGSLEATLTHLKKSSERLKAIETSEFKEKDLREKLEIIRKEYLKIATSLHSKRVKSAKKLEKEVEENLKMVALEKAKFVVKFETPNALIDEYADESFTEAGFDAAEFYFSANPGELPKPLAKVASGGEASRLMLILKTTIKKDYSGRVAVFDEVDAGIGGRVAEAVGLKLRALSDTRQVLCVTHHPQVAALANHHFLIEKEIFESDTKVNARQLDEGERIEEVARMLAGEQITESARAHARKLINGTRFKGKGIN